MFLAPVVAQQYSAGRRCARPPARRRHPDVEGVVTLEHVRTRRLGHDDILPGANLLGQGCDILPGRLLELGHVALVEPGGAAALGPLGNRAGDAVALVDTDESRPIAGSMYSMKHVGNTAASFVVGRLDGLCHLNHVVNRWRA